MKRLVKMKVKKAPTRRIIFIVVILLLILIYPKISYSQTYDIYPKDPQLALVLSIIDPAFGMFYAGEPSMGIFYWAIDKAAFFSTVMVLFEVKISFPPDIGFYIELRLRDLDFTRALSAVILGGFFIGFRVFSVLEARNKTLEYNRRILNDKIYLTKIKNDIRLYMLNSEYFCVGLRFDI